MRVAEWSGPGSSSFSPVGAAHEGEKLAVICQAVGQDTVGANGASSAIWDRLSTGAFVSDFYVDAPTVGSFSPPIPPCRGLGTLAP